MDNDSLMVHVCHDIIDMYPLSLPLYHCNRSYELYYDT
jgi:hypothetical protein